MSRNIKLSIAEPCHENWDKMSPVEKGKFCGSCQKQVIDFSDMSDRQIAEFFKKPSTGSVCGRFMTEQLERPIGIPRKRVPWLKFFLGFLLPALFITKASGQSRKMGKVAAPRPDTTRTNVNDLRITLGMVLPTSIKPVCKDTSAIAVKGEVNVVEKKILKGKVLDEENRPVPFANILIVGTAIVTTSNEKGEFIVMVPAERDSVKINVTIVGYSPMQKVIVRDNWSKTTVFKLNPFHEVIAGLVAVTEDREQKSSIKPIVKEGKSIVGPLLVFPNPVNSGENCVIACNELPVGDYSAEWISLSGQTIFQQTAKIVKGQSSVLISVPVVSKGQYLLTLRSRLNGAVYSEKVVVN